MSSDDDAGRSASPGAPAGDGGRRRKDIQGLRAVCMMQVLAYHAWRIGSPIGVDAFIMISAYLMTGSFVRRTEAGRMPFFAERWANTFKRLLPPLVVTVLATLGASALILPQTRWDELITQGFASVTYWQNWRLAAVSANYFAANRGVASPLQHLW
ncbi:MAG: acyltransferase family protein, partial [Propionibacterium acidifaciens]